MYKYAIGASAILIGVTSPMAAMGQSSHVSISGRVPTICTVSANLQATSNLTSGINSLGRLVELCNNREGYRLVLNHPSGILGAAILLDGERIAIAPSSTQTVLVDSNYAAFEERQLDLELTASSDPLPLTLYAEPKGAIF